MRTNLGLSIVFYALLSPGCGGGSSSDTDDASVETDALPDVTDANVERTDASAIDATMQVGIVVDGAVGVAEWAEATLFTNATTTSGTPFQGNGLTRLWVLRDQGYLHIAVEGTLSGSHAILAYVDRDVGGSDGLIGTTSLADPSGALDSALSTALLTPVEFRVDFAWGAMEFNRSSVGLDDRMGWRDLAIPTDLVAIDASIAPTVCGALACETSIPLATLGTLGTTIGIFVRLVDTTNNTVSNQTLPFDVPLTPEIVGIFANVPP